MPLVDLHCHTTASDGRLSPAGIVEKAAIRSLAGLAITDHDTTAALPVASIAAQRAGVTLISGVELSADVDGRDVHILGFNFDPSHAPLRAHLAAFREGRLERARAMTRRLTDLGAPVSMERVLAFAGGGAVGRPHVARALVEAGHVDTMGQAFMRYLGDQAPGYVPKRPVAPATLIDLVRDAGGVTVLAHPAESIDEAFVREMAGIGLRGLEVQHPSHEEATAERWREVALSLDLVPTGGSDYHGFRPGDEESFGTYGTPAEDLERLFGRSVRPLA